MNRKKKRIKQRSNTTLKHANQRDSEALQIQATKGISQVKPSLLQRYLWETHQHVILSEEEKRELAIRVHKYGDEQATNKLIISNLRLVVKIALQFQEIWRHNFLDLVQEGNLGLMQAVKRFDPLRGVKFSYYAVFWIRAYVLRFVMNHCRLVKIGTTQNQRKLFFRLNKEKENLKKEGFEPNPKLFAERLGVSEKDITEMEQRLNKPEISLDASIKEDSDDEFIGFFASDKEPVDVEVGRKQVSEIVQKALVDFRRNCNERELGILENRLMAETPLTLQQIGNRYGISRERVRQIQSNMLTELKMYFELKVPGFASLRFGLA